MEACKVMDQVLKRQIEVATREMRREAIDMTYAMGRIGAHIGGGLSLIEIMGTLYLGVLKYDKDNMDSDQRDRVVFSKGHGTLALYTAMAQAGIIEKEDLALYKKDDSWLTAHPSLNGNIGVEFSSGSLGQGLSLAVGVSLALSRKNNQKSKIYVILGDGECNEGSIWEAAQSASHFKCKNIVVIVDCNGLQYDGTTEEVMCELPFEDKWIAFGWDTCKIDGHDIEEIYDSLNKEHDKPLAILAKTVKGKGISFMENNPLWHNHSLSSQQYEEALNELGVVQ